MKNKLFLPNSVSWWLYHLLIVCFIGLGVFLIIISLDDSLDFLVLSIVVCVILLTMFFQFMFCYIFGTIIIFRKGTMVSSKNKLIFLHFRIQKGTTLRYEEIESVKIIEERIDSNGKYLPRDLRAGLPPRWLEFTIKGQRNKKRFWINFYTEKQMYKILTEIKLRMKMVGNETEFDIDLIMSQWRSWFDRKSKRDR